MVDLAQFLEPYGKRLIHQVPHLQEKLSLGMEKMEGGRVASQEE